LKVILACNPLAGHVNPIVVVARILVENGHDVVGYTASKHGHRFTEIGARFQPFPADIDRDLSDVDALFPERRQITPGPDMLLFDVNHVFADPVADQHKGLVALLRDFPADVIIADAFFLGTMPMLLGPKTARPAIVHCNTSALISKRDDGAPFGPGLPPAQTDEQKHQYSEIESAITNGCWDPARRYLNQILETLGRGPLTMHILEAVVRLPDLFLQPTVPGFEYPRRILPPALHFVGALPPAAGNIPLPPWAAELDGARRTVLVTQGTVTNFDFGQLVEPALKALANRSDTLVIVSAGGRPVETLAGPLPDNVRVASLLPYDWLMPKLDLMITNGGYGTVSQALRLGVPIVAGGISEDKAEVAARIAWSGVGINLGTSTPTIEAIREAADTILDGSEHRLKAKALSLEFARYDTAAELLRLLDKVTSSSNARVLLN
jgi:UDP:flavonoid glycosyltransferase YjiC (YdhE family)